MTRFSLLMRNLRYFRPANLAVIAGMAVATAVLTGALLVGDSVRLSLRELALRRLGPVDYALVATRFFDQRLAERLRAHRDFNVHYDRVVAGVVVRGGASTGAEGARRSTAGVQIAALGEGGWVTALGDKAVANGELADALGLKAGAEMSFSLPIVDDAPGDALLAKRRKRETTTFLDAKVDQVSGEGFASLFSLDPSQRTPRNVWVDLGALQDAVKQEGNVNMLLAGARGPQNAEGAARLNRWVKEVARLEDYGLRVGRSKADPAAAMLTATSTYLPPTVEKAAAEAARAAGAPAPQKVLTYFVNWMEKEGAAATRAAAGPASRPAAATRVARGGARPAPDAAPDGRLYYNIVAGLDQLDGTALADDAVAVNARTAEQLELKEGDRIRFAYYVRHANGELAEVESPLRLKVVKVVSMAGIGADASLTPEYPGMTDADRIQDWKAPAGMVIKNELADEEYWNKHKAAPRLFVSLATARKLWGQTYGDLTGLRIPADKAEVFKKELLARLDPAATGLSFRAIKAEQLSAAGGGTDFGGLFLALSFFLILSAGMLVAMLFRLNVERRARQVGLLSAIGFKPKVLRRLALGEGLVLALLGGAIGTALGIGYTAVIVYGLRTWWRGAVGTTAIRLHVTPSGLTIGFVVGVVLAMLAMLWAVRRVGRAQVAGLLAGGWGIATTGPKRQRVARSLGLGGVVLGAALLLGGAALRGQAQMMFLGGGFFLLVGVLAMVALRLRPREGHAALGLSLAGVSVRNAGRHPARSVLSMSLIALATFVLILVASMRQGPPANTHEKSSGAGGFRLMLQADIPIRVSLATVVGREALGITDPKLIEVMNRATFVPMRSWAGQDISCLNLTRPDRPTIFAVPAEMVERNAFAFADVDAKVAGEKKVENGWALLAKELPGGAIPVIADHETAQYILKLSLGQTIEITDQRGRAQKLQLVAALKTSIFQSVLLMGHEHFARLFPNQGGATTILIDAANKADAEALRAALPTALADFSVIVDRTADRLAMYAEVQNTYLATFQTLGALGLMLGTIGLAVVLLRNLFERRSELALLAAIGFPPRARLRLVLVENAFLLLVGLAVGGGCALLAVLPTVLANARAINPMTTGLALAAVLVTGLAALALAVTLGGRQIKVADLRAE